MHPPYPPLRKGGKKDQTPPTFPPLRRGGGRGVRAAAHAMHLKTALMLGACCNAMAWALSTRVGEVNPSLEPKKDSANPLTSK